MGAYNVTMSCCTTEEIVQQDEKLNVPFVDSYPVYDKNYNFPRSDSQLTIIALEDNKNL